MTPAELQKDVERYAEIDKLMRDILKLGIEGRAEAFEILWKEREEVKNRHSGFIPMLPKQIAEKS